MVTLNPKMVQNCPTLKNWSPPAPPSKSATPDLGQKSKIHSQILVCLIECFPKWYDTTRSTKNRRAAKFLGESLDAGQGLPSGDWVEVLPTQQLPTTNQATPEKFIQISTFFQRFSNIF